MPATEFVQQKTTFISVRYITVCFHAKSPALTRIILSTMCWTKTVFGFLAFNFFYLVNCYCALYLTVVCLLMLSIETNRHYKIFARLLGP